MPVHNEEVARAFDEMADLLSLKDDNPFRIGAYRRAAQSIRGQRRELAERIEQGEDPDDIAGIGKDLAAKIREFVATDRMRALDVLRRQVPRGLIELMSIPGLGPKRVRALHQELKVRDRADLSRALKAGALARVPGLGPKLIARIASELKVERPEGRRWLRSDTAQFAEPLAAWLRAIAGVEQVTIAGSYRRGRDTVGDIDIVVGAIHGHFDLKESRQTMRVLKAMDHRAFSILAHPGGRLIGERPPLALDYERVVNVAKARPCFLELDSQPRRLDLDDLRCRLARDRGVLVSIASDAHAVEQFDYLAGGVLQARRGWLTAGDVLNTRPLGEVRRLLKSTIVKSIGS